MVIGLFMAIAGWTAGLLILGRLLKDERGTTWHARSCFAALVLGWIGLLAFIVFVLGGPAWLAFASIKIGSFGLLLPVYITVAHRMFPFFASGVVPDYQPWRPLAWLGWMWALLVVHLVLELMHAYAWLWLADAPLLVMSTVAVWRWWPRGPMPGLLATLFIGLLWLPATFGLYLVQSLTYLQSGEFVLGRAPMHALFIARGPAFRSGAQVPAFDNVDVYPLLARLLHVAPAPNDGDLAPLLPALRDDAAAGMR